VPENDSIPPSFITNCTGYRLLPPVIGAFPNAELFFFQRIDYFDTTSFGSGGGGQGYGI
jgi:hypothetical protein